MRKNFVGKLDVADFDSTFSSGGNVLYHKDEYPIPFMGGKLYLYRDICGSVPVSELIKFPFPIYSVHALEIDNELIPHQENYFVILQSINNSLKTSIRILDPFSDAVELKDSSDRQKYMLEMQSIAANDPNYTVKNNQNNDTQIESHISLDSYDLRPKIFDSFDIEWTSTGETYEDILEEADIIVEFLLKDNRHGFADKVRLGVDGLCQGGQGEVLLPE